MGFRNLTVYQKAFALATRIFELTKAFPIEEKYSLTDQIRRSSRSICANIAEAYRKRIYPNHFILKLSDSDAECSETIVWLDFALRCGYLDQLCHDELLSGYDEVGKMLSNMIATPEKFSPRKN